MRNLKTYLTALLLFAVAFFIVSCDDNDEIGVDPNATFEVELEVTDDDQTPDTTLTVDPVASATVLAKVSFISETSMKRLYITQNFRGEGEEKYRPDVNADFKNDGSIDLSGKDDKNFQFQFELPVPSGLGDGTIVYKFWTTEGIGDFREVNKRLAIGAGTITIKAGTATNPTAEVESYPTVKLFAPTAVGTSKTFVSLLDGVTYNVSQGIEYVSLWDFGYLYSESTSDKATLRAPYNYNIPYYPGALDNPIIDIPAKAGTTNDELNKTYFKKSLKNKDDFDGITTSSQLSFVSVTENDENIRITALAVDDVIEFIDQYGKKGLIKVKEINPGNGSDKYIVIAIKVQP